MLSKKSYDFDFGNNFKKFSSYILIWFSFFGLIIMLIGLRMYFTSNFLDGIENKSLANYISKFIKYFIDAFALYGILIQFFPKKIILDEKSIRVKRNCFIRLTSGPFNDCIKYKNIKVCRMNHSEYKYHRYLPLTFPFCNWESVVVVEEKLRTFYIPVKNADEFVAEVNKRMKNTGDGSLC